MIQENASELAIEDADTDVLFDREIGVLDEKAYITLKALVLKSARDFQRLYDAVPDKDRSVLPERSTFTDPYRVRPGRCMTIPGV